LNGAYRRPWYLSANMVAVNWGASTALIAPGSAFFLSFYLRLIVEDDAEQRAVDFHFAVVTDESESAEFVHEETYPRPGCPDHVCERLLADLRNDRLGFALL